MYTAKVERKYNLWRQKRERLACAAADVWVYKGARVQYKGYNLIGVTTVEEGATIGMTALVYWQLHSSLYTGAVQGYWSTPDWSDRRQGYRQVCTDCLLWAHCCHRWGDVRRRMQNLMGGSPSDGGRARCCHGDCLLPTDCSELCIGQQKMKICQHISNSRNMVLIRKSC